jgi:Fic family protein
MPFLSKQPYELTKLPPPVAIADVPDLLRFLEVHNQALQEVSQLNGALMEIKRPDLFLSPFYLKEAINSSAVENIHTTIESALEDETRSENERRAENKEVMNYRTALLAGIRSQESFGLSSRTIKAIHKELKVKKGVPGEFRRVQNNIANVKRDGTSDILYTPPVASSIEGLIGNWEKFVSEDKNFFPLIRAAIAHYQFEAIHPFEDGNGRTGRILIILQMLHDEILSHPALFVSGYISDNEDRYKRLLLEVTRDGQWWPFVNFMLVGFATQALKTRLVLEQLKIARREVRESLYKRGKKLIRESNIPLVVDHIFHYPTTHPSFMERDTGIHWQTCSKYLKALAGEKILSEDPRGKYKFFRNKRALDALILKRPGDRK